MSFPPASVWYSPWRSRMSVRVPMSVGSVAKRWGEALANTLFISQFALAALLFGGARAATSGFWLSLAASATVLYSLRIAASPAIRFFGALILGAVWSANILVFRYYHLFIDDQLVRTAAHQARDVIAVAKLQVPALATLGFAIFVFMWRLFLRRSLPPHARFPQSFSLAAGVVFGAAALLIQSSNYDLAIDIRTARAFAGLRHTESATTTPIMMPPLARNGRALPNVLFILTESVRADSVCSAPDEPCVASPEVDRAATDRIALGTMRSVASYTSLAFNALLTGRIQTASKSELLGSPTLFHAVHALRSVQGAPTVAYWSAQARDVFERNDAKGFVDSWVTLETLLGREVPDEDALIALGLDQKLESYIERNLHELHAPYFLFAHFAGTHAPYYVNPNDAPFAPWGTEVSWGKMAELKNAYLNAVHEQDKSIAHVIRTFREAQGGPWAIIFTSDHGEAFGEHSAIHHGQNLYDEQIRVPAWILTSNDLLSPEQRSALLSVRDQATTHLDLFPTLLDLYGVEDSAALSEIRATQPGTSLLRRSFTPHPIPITNCTELFPCPLNTWGMLGGEQKWVAQAWDADFHCMNLRPHEHEDSPEQCRSLRDIGRGVFDRLPNGQRAR